MMFDCQRRGVSWMWKSVAILVACLAVAATQKNEGIAVWSNGNSDPPEYAIWDGFSDFSASNSMRDTGLRWKIIQGAHSPTRNEAIVVGISEDFKVTAQMYNGVTWTELPFSPLTEELDKTFLYGFDVRYESLSGNAVLVWHRGGVNSEILYRTWSGSSWSSESSIRVPVRGRDFKELRLESSPISNEMVLAVHVKQESDFCIVWDGKRWDNGLNLNNVNFIRFRVTNVVYEQKSGRAIIVFVGRGHDLPYRIWNGSSWSSERHLTLPWADDKKRRVAGISISADPTSNRIVMGVTGNSRYSFWLAVWDGRSRWESVTEAASESPAVNYHGLAVAFEGNSGKALAVYGQESNRLRYRSWSGRWSREELGPELGDTPQTAMLSTSPGGNEIMLSVQDYAQDAYFSVWDGLSWGNTHKMTHHGTIDWERSLQPFLFLWNPILAPVSVPPFKLSPAPTLNPTSSPTMNPTPAPSPHPTPIPTLTPTQTPTDQPTRTPSAAPTPIPTPDASSTHTQNKGRGPPLDKTTSSNASANADTPKEARGTGQTCSSNGDCTSNTCRNGVCMASSECYPIKHKYGTPFDKHKVNIVFVASGFVGKKSSHEAWRAQVNTTYAGFEQFNMFKAVEQVNVFLVDPEELDSSFCSFGCANVDRLLCCNVKKAHSLSSKCFSVGENLQTVIIHNSGKYGGAGFTSQNIATLSTHPHAPLVAAHELGHSLFHLTDEYSYGPGTDSDPNCDASSCEKWSDLVGRQNTPEGYDTVQCIAGCNNGDYFIGMQSFMEDLSKPMGAVNERFTCCTYQALTKSMPSYCNVFDRSTNYLFDYCKNNDYQGYGSSNYDLTPKLAIPGAVSVDDAKANYVYVSDPVLVTITLRTRSNGNTIFRSTRSSLQPGIFQKSQVEGDFRKAKAAAKKGIDSLLKVVVTYRTGKEVLLFSQNTTIDVPLPLPDGTKVEQQDEPNTVSEKLDVIEVVLDTKGRGIKKVRSSVLHTR